ncbi:MAG TPA: hypothetical protein ACFCU0_08930 [Longibacter sp.]
MNVLQTRTEAVCRKMWEVALPRDFPPPDHRLDETGLLPRRRVDLPGYIDGALRVVDRGRRPQ